jgi:RNA polymerase sigma-70 factor (ECF subfamily)
MSTPPVTIDELVTEHSAAMYRVALSMMRDHALAEDIVQESIMKAWQALGSFRGESSVKTWLLRITHNTAISALRKRRDDLMSPYELPDTPASGSVEDEAVLHADAHEIWAALRRLDDLSRTIVVLREVDQMSYEEIAEILELPIGTVRTRLFRARHQLAKSKSTIGGGA